MIVTMTAKNQLTIPKKIAKVLGLEQGAMFNIFVRQNKIELKPIEIVEKTFSKKAYIALDKLTEKEQSKGKKVTKQFINKLKECKI